MKKKDLQKNAGISSVVITKIGKSKHVNTKILQKICIDLDYTISDILEIIPENQSKERKLT